MNRLLIVLLLAGMMYCSESLPAFVEPAVNFDVSIRMYEPNQMINFIRGGAVKFIVSATNNFDETFSGPYDFQGKIIITAPLYSGYRKTLDFHWQIDGYTVVYPPGQTVDVCHIDWFGNFDNGNTYRQMLPYPQLVRYMVKVEFQPLKKINKLMSESVECTVIYY